MPPRASQVRSEKLLHFIQAEQPTHFEALHKFYNKPDEAGRQMFQRDLRKLRLEHEIVQDEDGRYILLQTARTQAILANMLGPMEQALLTRIQREFTPGHPYAADVRLLIDKLAGRLNQQSEELQRAAPLTYFGPRLARDYQQHRSLIEKLEECITNKESIQLVNSEPVSRDVAQVLHVQLEPQHLEIRHGTLYLYAYSTYKERCYYYRVDKIRELKSLGRKFGAFRNREHYMIQFEYLLHPSLVKGGISERFYKQELIQILPDNHAHLRASEDNFWIKQEVLRLGRKIEILSPARLREELATEIEEMRDFYLSRKIDGS